MKYQELQKKSPQELQKMLAESRVSIREMRFKVANDQLKNVREIRGLKKTIAQILLLLGGKPVAGKKSVVVQSDMKTK